jgi:hypothetical protein
METNFDFLRELLEAKISLRHLLKVVDYIQEHEGEILTRKKVSQDLKIRASLWSKIIKFLIQYQVIRVELAEDLIHRRFFILKQDGTGQTSITPLNEREVKSFSDNQKETTKIPKEDTQKVENESKRVKNLTYVDTNLDPLGSENATMGVKNLTSVGSKLEPQRDKSETPEVKNSNLTEPCFNPCFGGFCS